MIDWKRRPLQLLLMAVVSCFALGCSKKPSSPKPPMVSLLGTQRVHVPPSKHMRQCLYQCQSVHQQCSKQCRNSSKQCHRLAEQQADKLYHMHQRQQSVVGKGKLYNTDQAAYVDPFQCAKASCDCDRDYSDCYRLCHGVVQLPKSSRDGTTLDTP